ncbi:MAG: hypothetical protein HRT89_06835, partial [Lentisphaeria bacterium]|nr:hypothetical protein [Lentisphaeria bacterium]
MTKTDSITTPGPMVRIADLLYRALKLARRRWYVVLVLALICASPLMIVLWRVHKIKSGIAQLIEDNPQIDDWSDTFIATVDPDNPKSNLDIEDYEDIIYLPHLKGLKELDFLKNTFTKHLELNLYHHQVKNIGALKGIPLQKLI